MSRNKERVLILVKALPQVSERHGESVCCAGVTENREWRRQYPIRFRFLEDESRFRRWQWLEYTWRIPRNDPRKESRRVNEESLTPGLVMREEHRADFLNPMLLESPHQARERGDSLALIRPDNPRFFWKRKTDAEIAQERGRYEEAVRQQDLFAEENERKREIEAFTPCPYDFRYAWRDPAGAHDLSCADWETTATFRNFSKRYGEDGALERMSAIFG